MVTCKVGSTSSTDLKDAKLETQRYLLTLTMSTKNNFPSCTLPFPGTAGQVVLKMHCQSSFKNRELDVLVRKRICEISICFTISVFSSRCYQSFPEHVYVFKEKRKPSLIVNPVRVITWKTHFWNAVSFNILLILKRVNLFLPDCCSRLHKKTCFKPGCVHLWKR